MPRRFRDYTVAAAALALLAAALTRIDDRVPASVAAAVADVTSGRWTRPGSPVGDMLLDVAGSPAFDNIFVVGMVGAAVVLAVLMVRT